MERFFKNKLDCVCCPIAHALAFTAEVQFGLETQKQEQTRQWKSSQIMAAASDQGVSCRNPWHVPNRDNDNPNAEHAALTSSQTFPQGDEDIQAIKDAIAVIPAPVCMRMRPPQLSDLLNNETGPRLGCSYTVQPAKW